MTFSTPILALIAAAVLIPALVILYFLKLRRRDVEVSTTLLWKKSIQDLQANAPFQKLRRNILLILQLLILALGLLALAQPEQRASQPPGAKTVLLIDRSASMSAEEPPGSGSAETRLDRAKREALAQVDSMRSGGILSGGAADEAMVITFDRYAEVAQPFTFDKVRLRAAIEAIEPSDASTTLDEALRLAGTAGTMIEYPERGLIRIPGPPAILFSDGEIADLARLSLPPEASIEFKPTATPGGTNIAITALRAERSFGRVEEVSIFLAVQSTDPEPRSVDAELIVEGLVAAVRPVSLPGAKSPSEPAIGGIVFKLDRPERAIVTARIIVGDALLADNTAHLVLPPAKRLSIALVTKGSEYLREALDGLGLARLDVIAPPDFQKLLDSGKPTVYDIFILDRWVPNPVQSNGVPTLPPGRYLILGEVPTLRGISPAPASGEPRVSAIIDWKREHPALRSVNFSGVLFDKPLAATLGDEAIVLANGSAGPAIVEAADGPARAIAVLFDPTRSNWPFDLSLVMFLARATQHLGDDGALTNISLVPGDTLSTHLPPGVREAQLTLPGERMVQLFAADDGRVSYGPLRRAGLYSLTWPGAPGPSDSASGGRATRQIAVNMLDPEESRLGVADKLELASGTIGAAASQSQLGIRRWWPWLLLAAAAGLMLEWLVYNRRVHL